MNAERAAASAGVADPTTPAGATPPSAPASASTPTPAPGKHVGGIELGLSAIWAVIKNFFRRLFGGGKPST